MSQENLKVSSNLKCGCGIFKFFWLFFFFLLLFFFKILFIYLTQRERQTVREGTQAGGVGEEEAGFPLSREADSGFDPGTLGSRPEPKADA